MSRVKFFQDNGLTVHRVFNIPELTPQILHESRDDDPEDAILICSGYKDTDGNYEYLSVSGKTCEELTPIIDQNIKELRTFDTFDTVVRVNDGKNIKKAKR